MYTVKVSFIAIINHTFTTHTLNGFKSAVASEQGSCIIAPISCRLNGALFT